MTDQTPTRESLDEAAVRRGYHNWDEAQHDCFSHAIVDHAHVLDRAKVAEAELADTEAVCAMGANKLERVMNERDAALAKLAALQPAFVPDEATRLVEQLHKALQDVLPYTEAERLAEASAVRIRAVGHDPINKAVRRANEALAAIEVLRKHLSRGPFAGLPRASVAPEGLDAILLCCDTGAHRDQWLAALKEWEK